MVHEVKARRKLVQVLMHPTRLAVLLVIATAEGGATLTRLAQVLGLPRQTVHSHIEILEREGLVVKKWVISDRPRVVYSLKEDRALELLKALEYLKKNVEVLEKALKSRYLKRDNC